MSHFLLGRPGASLLRNLAIKYGENEYVQAHATELLTEVGAGALLEHR